MSKKTITVDRDKVNFYDTDTHKVIPIKEKKNTEKFQQLYQGPSIIISMICSGGACKLMFYILGKGDYSNYIEVEQDRMAQDLGMDKKSIQRHLKELRELGILNITNDPNDTRRNVYTINPHYTWRTTDEKRRIFLRARQWTKPNEAFEQLALKGVQDGDQLELL